MRRANGRRAEAAGDAAGADAVRDSAGDAADGRRRALLAAASSVTGVIGAAAAGRARSAEAAAGTAWKPSDPALAPASAANPLNLPRTEFVYESVFDLLPTLQLGASPYGERRIVPIAGGRFQGPRLAGKVLPGGADRQLVRSDGATVLDARYELQTDDGTVISVRNQVLSRPGRGTEGARYLFSTLEIVAPDGPYGWLNDWVHVGTLHSLRPEPKVLIRVYRLV